MSEPFRILIVDDNESIHQDFGQILGRRAPSTASLDELERMLGGEPTAEDDAPLAFELHSVYQGADAIREVTEARTAGRPYAVAFVDIRMPPGMDGVETIAGMWERQPELEVVLCSAYNDYSWEDITKRLRPGDRLVVLRKPFDPIEVRQLAACLSEKWQRGRELDDQLRQLQATVQSEVDARMRERAAHEEEQRRSARLEALGRLAAGIAHEINTPTQFIASNLEYLAALVPSLEQAFAQQRFWLGRVAAGELSAAEAYDLCGKPEAALVEELQHAVNDTRTGLERIARIVQTVRSHAHLRDRECLVATDVNEQVRAALELGRNEYKYDADTIVKLGDVPAVMGDPGDLALAILNLIVNAAHAIREKRKGSGPRGTITVSTRVVGECVEVAIADTGGGIPVELRERVFEPFFTTKPIGQGTGQGLSIARTTIVERHHGTLKLETEVGAGTTFTIGLPVLVANAAASGGAT
jgi:two-component system, NtrC family, sensor kinase